MLWETRDCDNIFLTLTVHWRQLGRLQKKKTTTTTKKQSLGPSLDPTTSVSGGGAQVSVHCEHLQVILMSIRGWEPSGHSGVSQKLLINKM